MKKDSILIIAGGLLQIPAVMEAKKLGLHTIVTDKNINASAMRYADEQVEFDIYDIAGHIKLTERLMKEYNLRGIFTAGADVEETVAYCAQRAGLIGIPVLSAETCKDKSKMHLILGQCGIEMPTYLTEDYWKDSDFLGETVVIKPVRGCGSRGVKIIKDPLSDKWFLGWRSVHNPDRDPEYLFEQYISGGDHFSVEILRQNGKTCRLSYCKREFDDVVELRYYLPVSSTVPYFLENEMYNITEKVAKILRIDNGVMKCDFIGYKLGECTARLSGGMDSAYSQPLALGTNPTRAALCISIGEPVDEKDVVPQKSGASYCEFLYSDKVGILEKIESAEILSDFSSGFPLREKCIILRKSVGDFVNRPVDGSDRIGYAFGYGKTIIEAKSKCSEVLEPLKITVTEGK